MKKYILWGSISVIAIAGISYAAFKPNSQTQQKQPPLVLGESPSSTITTTFSLIDLGMHNTRSDCWVAISGKVYDVTSIIDSHPGGPGSIVSECGKDATSAFLTRNGRGPHPPETLSQLNSLYKGTLRS